MTFYTLADYRLRSYGEVIEFYVSRDEAEAELQRVLADEPAWEGEIGIVPVEFPYSPQ